MAVEIRPERRFKGVWIPADLWLDRALSVIEKVMIAEIDSLSSTDRGCWATNAHFAKFFDVTGSRASQIISDLARRGYLRVEHQKDGERIIGRSIFLVTPLENLTPPLKFSNDPPLGNAEGSNTKSNNPTARAKALVPLLKKVNEVAPGDEVYSEGFERFWVAFPRKRRGAKADAFGVWVRRHYEQYTDKIVQDVESKAKLHRQWLDGFAPAATTYLNKRGWTEDLETTGSDDHAKETPFERTLRLQQESREDLVDRARTAGFDF